MHKIRRRNIILLVIMIVLNFWSFDEIKFVNPELFTVTGSHGEYYKILFHGLMGVAYSIFVLFLFFDSLFSIFKTLNLKGKTTLKWSIVILYILMSSLSDNMNYTFALIIQGTFILQTVSDKFKKQEWIIFILLCINAYLAVHHVFDFQNIVLLNYCYLMSAFALIIIGSVIGNFATRKRENRSTNIFFNKLSFVTFMMAIITSLSMGSFVNTNKDLFQLEHPENAAPLSYICDDTYLSSPFPFYIKSNKCLGSDLESNEQSKFFAVSGSARAYADSLSFAKNNKERIDIAKQYYKANERLDEKSWVEINKPELFKGSILDINKTPYLAYKDFDMSLIKAYESNNQEESFELVQEQKDMASTMKENSLKNDNKESKTSELEFMSPLAYYFDIEAD